MTLSGTSSSGLALTYAWAQVSGETVALAAAKARATFAAPAYVSGGTNRLEFELTVTDQRNRQSTDRVVVTVIKRPQVRLRTSKGDIVVELEPTLAPKHTANFLTYVDEGFYNGTLFHRVIADFVIQGGGFDPNLAQKPTHDPVPLEAGNGLLNVRGSFAAARTGDPNSATSQFFVNLKDNTNLDPNTASGNPGYTVFGRVVQGMDVVDEIATVATETRDNFQDIPVADILLISATREP
jgi:peptidyl-prolyl cis-trans isomerase A (cyclophilin A)